MTEKRVDVLRDEFMEKIIVEWHTPHTYDSNYRAAPKFPGVYCLIMWRDLSYAKKTARELIYIGASKNLSQRNKTHEVIENVYASYPSSFIQFYFKETLHCWEEEKELIRMYQPLLNRVRKFK